MFHVRILAALAVALTAAPAAVFTTMPAKAAEFSGNYIEVRNCDVWTGPCFANAEGNLTGMNGALVWHIDKGNVDNVNVDGLTVIAVLQATDTLGTNQSGATKSILIVDSRANELQRDALVKLAHRQGGALVANVLAVHDSNISVNICHCSGESCAEIDAGVVAIKTRCLDDKHDKHCGNETAYYPPLTQGVDCVPAVAQHHYNGSDLPATWAEVERRGAYVGTFKVR